MCTVTIIPVGGPRGAARSPIAGAVASLMRLACNRDELRTRPPAEPPVIRAFGRRRAIIPIDPLSGGTWIAVNDAGLAATLLNVNPEPATTRPPGPLLGSRGLLVPQLMAFATLADAAGAASRLTPRDYPPFRLVLADAESVVDARSDGRDLRVQRARLADGPHFFTSSGLGDALVEGPRRALFDEMFTPAADWLARQDAFHRHAWPDRRPLSVCMERAEARTVSHTIVEIRPAQVTLTYWPDAPDRAQPLHPVTLERTGASQ